MVNFAEKKPFYTGKNMSGELHAAYLAESNTQSVVHVSTQTLVQINPLYGGFCQVRLASLGSADVYLAESIV